MLLHTEQYVTGSFTSRTASTSRSVASRGVFRMWKARRCAPFGPMPGRRCSSSIKRVRGSGSAIENLESRELQPSQHGAHLLRQFLVGLAVSVVDRRDDQIL